MSTLLATQASRIRLLLEDQREVLLSGHVVLVSNTPYIISNNRVGEPNCFRDGLLDITLFTDLSKLSLVGHVLRESAVTELGAPGVLRYQVRKALIETTPAMPVMADSVTIGEGTVGVEVIKGALSVMVADDKTEGGVAFEGQKRSARQVQNQQ